MAGYIRAVLGPDPLTIGAAAGMGALQGVAEFLPISSSGHLALAAHTLGIDPERGGHTLSVVLHAGTLLAVLVYYRRELWALARDIAVSTAAGQRARRMVAAIFVATLPLALALVPAVKGSIVAIEGNVRWVGFALWVTAAALAFSHRRQTPDDDPNEAPELGTAALIGLAQLCAITPGISRSGATIACALALGLGRARAAQFSFLISIPAIAGATLDELTKLDGAGIELAPLAVGFTVSFVVGIACLGALLGVIKRVGLLPFVPYLLLVGAVAVWVG